MRLDLPRVKLDAEGGGDTMGTGAERPRTPVAQRPRIPVLPTTQLGWWAVGLAAAFFALVLVGTVVPRGGMFAVLCGAAGGVLALVAIVRDRERGLSVLAALAPLALAAGFAVAELVGGVS
jgi:hypothetical protein